MAVYRSGANSRILIGAENGFNTMPGTPVGHLLRKSQFTFEGIKDLIENPELRSDSNPAPDATGMQRVANAQLTMPISADEIGLVLLFFFGSYADSGAGPYTHVYKVSATQPSSVWVEVGDTEADKYDLFNGLYISSFSLGTVTKDNASMLMATINFFASGNYTLNGSASQDSSPDTYTDLQHTMPSTQVKVDATATELINEISFTMSRNIEGLGVLDGTLYYTDADLQKYMVDCTVRGWRDSADTIFGYDDGAEHSVEIISPRPGAATRYLSIELPEAYIFNSEGSGGVSGDGPVPAVARVRPFYVDNSDATSILVTVVSDVVDYEAVT